MEKLYLSIKKLKLTLSDPKKYYDLSHKLGVVQINTKKLQDKAFGLECNFDKLNGIDFKKGCYIGQENTARMKLKNKIRKRLLPVTYVGDLPEASEILFKEKQLIHQNFILSTINDKQDILLNKEEPSNPQPIINRFLIF